MYGNRLTAARPHGCVVTLPAISGRLGEYAELVGAQRLERVLRRGRALAGLGVLHVNSTFYGGGVAEILSSLTLLMNDIGLKVDWRQIRGSPDFFSITKKAHNALQGGRLNLSLRKRQIYEETIRENAVRIHLNHDFVVVHDPQPLPLILHYRKTLPWVWRCHVDLSNPDPTLWSYLRPTIEKYDAVILTLEKYRQELGTPQRFFAPAIDPFNMTNRELPEREIQGRLDKYAVPDDLPILLQVARFDRWKDPQGAIHVFERVRRRIPCTLVLLGSFAADDPEGQQVYESLLAQASERVRIISAQDSALVNALQRRAAVVLQMSIREGFGLTVSEALWKGAAVVARRAGGIPLQVEDGKTGYLIRSEAEAAERVVALLQDEGLRRQLGAEGRRRVRERFLMLRLLEDYLELLAAFEARFTLRGG